MVNIKYISCHQELMSGEANTDSVSLMSIKGSFVGSTILTGIPFKR